MEMVMQNNKAAPAAMPVEPVKCDRCQGNGEIVTDWDRYSHPREGDAGDEAVAECPDCGGEGVIDVPATPPAPAVAVEPLVCRSCNGKGYVAGDPEGDPIEGCDDCGGMGWLAASPAPATPAPVVTSDLLGRLEAAAVKSVELTVETMSPEIKEMFRAALKEASNR